MIPLTFADPVTLALIGTGIGGLAGAGSAAYSIFGPKPKAPSMPTPAPPAQSPTTGIQAPSTTGPSFLAAAAAPSQSQLGQKSLLGQ